MTIRVLNPRPRTASLPKRRIFLVDHDFQKSQAWGLAVHSVLSGFLTALLAAALLLLVGSGWISRLEIAIPVFVFMVTIANVSLSYVHAIRSSHQIAGPVFNLKRQLARVGQGDFTTRVHLRKTDELQALAQEFNSAVEFLQKRDETHRSRLQALASLLGQGRCAEAQESLTLLLREFETSNPDCKS